MNSARYYAGGEGRCFLYAKDATFQCPYAAEIHWSPDDTRDAPLTVELEDLIEARASVRINVTRLIAKAHGRNTTLRHPEQTDTCNACGAQLVKVGYRTWIEAPIEDPIHANVNDATKQLNSRFGATHLHVSGSTRYWPTKREAIQWAREEATIDRQP